MTTIEEQVQLLTAKLDSLSTDLASTMAELEVTKHELQEVKEEKVKLQATILEVKDSYKKNKPKGIVDPRDLIKPKVFEGTRDQFYDWAQKMQDTASIHHRKMRDIMEWAANYDEPITMDAAAEKLIDNGMEDPEEIIDQLYVMLINYTEDQALRVCQKAGRNGFEAWRLLNQRFDPKTAYNETALLTAINNPTRVGRLEVLLGEIEKWEQMIRRYELLTHDLISDRSKKNIIALLCPEGLEEHLKMNMRRLKDFEDVKAEIVSYVDLHSRPKKGTLGANGVEMADDEKEQPAEVHGQSGDWAELNRLGKGGAKGAPKAGGKGEPRTFHGACWGCGGPHPQFLCPHGKGGKGGKGKGLKGFYEGGKGSPGGKGGKSGSFQQKGQWPSPMPTQWPYPANQGKGAWSLEAAWQPDSWGQAANWQQGPPAQLGGLSFLCTLENNFAALAEEEEVDASSHPADTEGKSEDAGPSTPTCEGSRCNCNGVEPGFQRVGRPKRWRHSKKNMNNDQKELAQHILEQLYQEPDPEKQGTRQGNGAQDLNMLAEQAKQLPEVAVRAMMAASDNQEGCSQMGVNAVHDRRGAPAPHGGEWLAITMDSGAAESVMPSGRLPYIATLQTERSLAAQQQGGYSSATGETIPNRGEQQITMMTADGNWKGMRFQKTDVRKPLGSISRICEAGHRVNFEKNNNYIEDRVTGDRVFLREENGLYILDAWIPKAEASMSTMDFGRHGVAP